jgi:MFS family permease
MLFGKHVLLYLPYNCYFLERYILGPVLAVLIQSDLNITDQHLNVINGVALIGLQFSLFAGLVLDRFGARITVVIGFILSVSSWVGKEEHVLLLLCFSQQNRCEFSSIGEDSWIGVLLLLVGKCIIVVCCILC